MSRVYTLLLCTAFVLNSVVCASLITRCEKNDWDCLKYSLTDVLPKVLKGIPSLGIESSDPIHVEEVIGNLPTVQYVINDLETKGFSRCSVDNVWGDLTTLNYHIDIFCPSLNLSSKYVIGGQVNGQPIEGNGDFQFISTGYRSSINGDLDKIEDKNGKVYAQIKSVNIESEPVSPVTFKFTNLFNGQKDKSDAVHKYFNENWKETAKLLQDPVWNANMKAIVSNVNKFLKVVPVDEIMAN